VRYQNILMINKNIILIVKLIKYKAQFSSSSFGATYYPIKPSPAKPLPPILFVHSLKTIISFYAFVYSQPPKIKR
jgi:hypothetical protein